MVLGTPVKGLSKVSHNLQVENYCSRVWNPFSQMEVVSREAAFDFFFFFEWKISLIEEGNDDILST